MPSWKRVSAIAAIATAALACYLFRETLLTALGNLLVRSDRLHKADAVLVLAGDPRGQRILRACELLRDGYAPVVLVSGPVEWYGINEADGAIAFAERNGCPRQWFEPLFVHALSTSEEANAIAPLLAGRGVHELILVTSSYHTRRAGAIFERALHGSTRIHVIGAKDEYFAPDQWWRNREGQKTVFYEVSKTVAGWLGL